MRSSWRRFGTRLQLDHRDLPALALLFRRRMPRGRTEVLHRPAGVDVFDHGRRKSPLQIRPRGQGPALDQPAVPVRGSQASAARRPSAGGRGGSGVCYQRDAWADRSRVLVAEFPLIGTRRFPGLGTT